MPVSSSGAYACEYCGRHERRSFLGFRRPLLRMTTSQFGAVICVECLDRAGDLLNRSYRH
ncbi:hypothetical protein ACFWIW_24635 [Amycolatopsis sp. NPDC058340]|uniref:hypothetical protein n=1 Tax=Amycolatopsis sp. NPDC058340 TaxID=3346453 RepID=UPI003656D8D3